MAYVVKGFHLCPADSCSPGAVLPQHTGYSDSSLNRDSSDPFLWFFPPLIPVFLRKVRPKTAVGLPTSWQFPLERRLQVSTGFGPLVCVFTFAAYMETMPVVTSTAFFFCANVQPSHTWWNNEALWVPPCEPAILILSL